MPGDREGAGGAEAAGDVAASLSAILLRQGVFGALEPPLRLISPRLSGQQREEQAAQALFHCGQSSAGASGRQVACGHHDEPQQHVLVDAHKEDVEHLLAHGVQRVILLEELADDAPPVVLLQAQGSGKGEEYARASTW